jgi:signal peptidase I
MHTHSEGGLAAMNFALLLFSLLVVTGAISLADRLWLAERRPEGEKESWWVEYGKSFFPAY